MDNKFIYNPSRNAGIMIFGTQDSIFKNIIPSGSYVSKNLYNGTTSICILLTSMVFSSSSRVTII